MHWLHFQVELTEKYKATFERCLLILKLYAHEEH